MFDGQECFAHRDHLRPSGTGYPASRTAKYRYRIASAMDHAKTIAEYAGEGAVTLGNA